MSNEIRNVKQLTSWIEKNVGPDVIKAAGGDAKAAAYWFVAYQVATNLSEENAKGLARCILEGIGPVDDEFVNDWLEDQYSLARYEDLSDAEANEQLIDSLTDFFQTDSNYE